MNIKNILILGHKNIGDICGDVVIINSLKKRFPQAKIYFLTSPDTVNLIEGYQGIEEVIVIDKKNIVKTWGDRYHFNMGLWKYHFDMIIVLTRTWMHNYIYTRHVWNVRKSCRREFMGKKMHPIDIYLKFLNKHNVDAPEAIFDFNFDQEQRFCDEFFKRKGIKTQDRLIGILPFAAWAFKNWPIKQWNTLSKILKEDYQIKTIAFGKGTNGAYAEHVKENLSPTIISAINQTSLKQAAALIQRCHIFIGPDSSLLHLASCLKVQSIGLYGPTPIDYVYPYFHKTNIISPKERDEGMLCQIDPIHCPCKKPNKQPAACMEKIEVDDVLKTVLKIFK